MTAHELLHRLPELARPEALDGVDATVQADLDPPLHLTIRDGAVTTHDGPADAPNVTIRVSGDDLLALFRGELNPAAALFSGRVRVLGDVRLAQRLVGAIDRERLAEVDRG